MTGSLTAVSFASIVMMTLFLLHAGCIRSFLKTGFFSLTVFAALCLLKILSVFKIGVNIFTLLTAFIFGIPGIVSLLFFNILSSL